jgi:hypothetical protein
MFFPATTNGGHQKAVSTYLHLNELSEEVFDAQRARDSS